MEWEGLPVYPRGLDVYSNDVIPAYAAMAANSEHFDDIEEKPVRASKAIKPIKLGFSVD